MKKKYKRNKTPKDFWVEVQTSSSEECWEWSRSGVRGGYGRLNYNKTTWIAHRLSYYLTYGDIPIGMLVCHKCDNPKCCNPSHLFLGTAKENTQDCKSKNRLVISKGSDHYQSKLTKSDVSQIRSLYESGEYSYKALGKKYGVTNWTIRAIIKRRTWKHV